MDKREEPAPVQFEIGRYYTRDELRALVEPQYRADQDAARRCIDGLTDYAAQLAAKRQEEQVPQLRELCIEMAEFWRLAEDDTLKMEEQYGIAFDSAVSAARDSGYAPEMCEQIRQNILDGLRLYAREMVISGDLEEWTAEYGALLEQLQAECQAEAQINMEMGGL